MRINETRRTAPVAARHVDAAPVRRELVPGLAPFTVATRALAPPSAFAARLPLVPLAPPLPDPAVALEMRRDGPLYTMVGTTNESKDTFHIYQSRHRDGPWERVKDKLGRPLSIFTPKTQPTWISTKEPDRWAPELHNVDGQWVCTYTARHTDGDLRVAIAVSRKVTGPYHDLGPILTAPHGVIDSTIKHDRGKWVMVYKNDDNAVGEPTPILSRSFTLKGNDFAWTSEPHEIARSGAGHGGLLEGPAVVDVQGTTWIALSSDFFGGPAYKVWIGKCDDLLGGKVDDLQKLLTTESPCLRGQWKGPGHCFLLPEAPGIFSMYFHAWPAGTVDYGKWDERFDKGEGRVPLRVTVAFIDERGNPVKPYIVEDR